MTGLLYIIKLFLGTLFVIYFKYEDYDEKVLDN